MGSWNPINIHYKFKLYVSFLKINSIEKINFEIEHNGRKRII